MVSSHLTPLIIAGPTGSGKTSLALRLAKKHNGEIICADSRQFYSFMRIGTASPNEEDLKSIPHHGFNVFDPRVHKIDAGFFVDFAKTSVADCQRRGKRPIIVGGTGLYLRCLRFGLNDVPQSDKSLVALLEQECDERGLMALYEELASIDPESAEQIMASDRYRIVRSLEIYRQTGTKPSVLRKSFKGRVDFKAHCVFKHGSRENFEKDLLDRVLKMVEMGLVDEACRLRELVPFDHWALFVMGYEEALRYADGILKKDDMIERIFIRHRQYAKRQRSWFRREGFTWQIT